MRSSMMMILFGGVAVLGLMLAGGCGPADPDPAAPADPHEGHDHGDMPAEQAAALANLSPADRELAERQQICPVTRQPLGSMGTPVKITVEGRDVLLCCAGCEGELRANPGKYLDDLPQ